MTCDHVTLNNGARISLTRIDFSEGKSAITRFRVIDRSLRHTEVELEPITGGTHQLRVHCARILGAPIVGDTRYGFETHGEINPPLYLHAAHIKFPALEQGDVHVSAPLPPYMRGFFAAAQPAKVLGVS